MQVVSLIWQLRGVADVRKIWAAEMIILLILLALIFAHITYKDVKTRVIFRYDLFALVLLRIVMLLVIWVGAEFFESDAVLGLNAEQWSIRSLVMSAAVAIIVVALLQTLAYVVNRLTNKYGEKEESLGVGDVWLYGACCLFLSVEQVFLMVLLSALIGGVMALYVKVIKKQRTFPFAPAIVWATFVALVLPL